MNRIRDIFLTIVHDEGFNKKSISSRDIISKTDEVLKDDRLSPWHGFDLDKKHLILINELSSDYFKINGVTYTGKTCKVKNMDDIVDSILEKNKDSLKILLDNEVDIANPVISISELFNLLINNDNGFNPFNQDIYWINVKLNILNKLLLQQKNLKHFTLNNADYIYNKEKLYKDKDNLIFYIIGILKDNGVMTIDDLYHQIRRNPYYFALLDINKLDPSKSEKSTLRNVIESNELIKKDGNRISLSNSIKELLNTQLDYDVNSSFDLLKELSEVLLLYKGPMNLNNIVNYFSKKYKNLSQSNIKREIETISEDDMYKKFSIHKFKMNDEELYIHKDNCEFITNNGEYILNHVKDLMEDFLKEKEKSLIYPISNHLKKKLTDEFTGLSLSSILINDIIKRVIMEMLNRDLSIDNLRINLDSVSIEFMIDKAPKSKDMRYYEEHYITKSLKTYVKNELMILKDRKNDNLRSIEELTLYDEDSLMNYYKYHRDVDKLIVDLQKLDTIS